MMDFALGERQQAVADLAAEVLTGRPLVTSRTLAVSSHTAVEEEPAAASPLIV